MIGIDLIVEITYILIQGHHICIQPFLAFYDFIMLGLSMKLTENVFRILCGMVFCFNTNMDYSPKQQVNE